MFKQLIQLVSGQSKLPIQEFDGQLECTTNQLYMRLIQRKNRCR